MSEQASLIDAIEILRQILVYEGEQGRYGDCVIFVGRLFDRDPENIDRAVKKGLVQLR